MSDICPKEGCHNPMGKYGLCSSHYQIENRKAREFDPNSRRCDLDDCDRVYYANGLCRLHYERVRRTGTPEIKPRPRRDCAFEICDERAQWGEFCTTHAAQKRRGKPLTPKRPKKSPKESFVDENGRECSVCGVYKPWDMYYEHKKGNGDYRSWCKRCTSDKNNARAKERKRKGDAGLA